MKLALVGKVGSINHWLEDAAAAWRADGHDVRLAVTRRPWLSTSVERALSDQIAERLRRRLTEFAPDLIIAIGALHVPAPLIETIAALPGRPPLVGWVGDVFSEAQAKLANAYDLIGYTDSALMARHRVLGFEPAALYLPHAVDPGSAAPRMAFESRDPRMVFIANPTPHRRAVVSAISPSMVLYGPGWMAADRQGGHEVHPGRVAARRTPELLAAHQLSLNIRNEINVVDGLNQRNFEPCLAGAVLITDDQPDLELCFEPGAEVLVWRDAAEASAHYERVRRDPAYGAAIGAQGRERALAHHTFAHRLAALSAGLSGIGQMVRT